MNAREALRLAKDLGLEVKGVRRTGEVRVTFPDGRTITTAHPTRRKDCCALLEARLNQLVRAQASESASE